MNDFQQTSFGLKDGRMHTPAEVPSGLACACVCIDCGTPLVAKKGEINRWHFAHYLVETRPSCAESAIHAAAKQILLDQNWLDLPLKRITVSGDTMSGKVLEETKVLSAERIVRFDRSGAEVWLDGIRPDIVGYRGERQLLVEMYFRHQVDQDKRDKLSRIKLPAIEIDLSDLDGAAGFDAVAARVLHGTGHKSWLYFPNEDLEQERLQKRLMERIERANQGYLASKEADRQRKAAREQRREIEEARQKAAQQHYRSMSAHDKEQDLRTRLGISGDWPYYLCKENTRTPAIVDPAMIWQGALFSRFIFRKANQNSELKQDAVLNWVLARFETGSSTLQIVDAEVRRYLGYLSACGFLKKLPYNPYASQGYIVVHGELEPPAQNGGLYATNRSRPSVDIVEWSRPEPPLSVWVWRASWPKRAAMMETATDLLAGSAHAVHLEDMLQNLSPLNRTADPVDYATTLASHGVPEKEVMSFLNKLGLILLVTPGQTWER